MQHDLVARVKSNPKYQELVSQRSAFAKLLTIIMLVIYYGFILVIAFNPGLLATPLGPNTKITLGIPVGIAVIVSAFILTGIYVVRANSRFDELIQQVKEDVK